MLACLLAGAVVAPWAAQRGSTGVEAESLVIAQRLDMDLEALPRYAEAIFGNGEVELAVATSIGGVGDDIVPERVALIAEQDSLILRVVGRDPDPQTAAELANVAAEAFIQALNSTGAGIGLFGLQSPAEPPSPGQDDGLGTTLSVALGVATGLVLGIAVICLLLVLRRPVIESADAEEMTGVPALGTVTVPRTRRGVFPSPEAFTGLMPVCRRLLAMPTPTVLVVGMPRSQPVREQLSVAMASVMMRVRHVTFIGPADAKTVISRRQASDDIPEDPVDPGSDAAPPVTVVDSRDTLDLVHPAQVAATVLVAPVGIRSASLREAVVEHLGGSSESRIVLVKRGRRTRGESVDKPGGTGDERPLDRGEDLEPDDRD
jgi:hypothetical protein